jgi:hypothetical protein
VVLAGGRVPAVPAGTGQLRLSGNQLDWIALGEQASLQVLEALNSDAQDPFAGLPLWDEALITGNTFRGRPQVLVADVVSFGANSVSEGVTGFVGFAFGNAATAIGNIGPSPRSVLVVSSSQRGIGQNVRLVVQP